MNVQFVRAGMSMWIWAVLLRPLKRHVPLDVLVRVMHRKARRSRSRDLEARLERYMERRERFPFRAPGNCLERSLAAYRVLCGLSAAPELVVGFRQKDSKVQGHVWVMVDGRPLAESSASLEGYTATEVFDATGRRRGRAYERSARS